MKPIRPLSEEWRLRIFHENAIHPSFLSLAILLLHQVYAAFLWVYALYSDKNESMHDVFEATASVGSRQTQSTFHGIRLQTSSLENLIRNYSKYMLQKCNAIADR